MHFKMAQPIIYSFSRNPILKTVVNSKIIKHSMSSTENPIQKTINIFKNDFADLKNVILNKPIKRVKKFPSHCDVLVIGGGVMGSSVAYWLKQRALDGLKVVVVDRDFTVNFFDYNKFQKSSTVLSVGGLRQQFSLKENIELSLASAEFIRNISLHLTTDLSDPADIQFNPAGYLFLASNASAHILEENAALQKSLGAKVELLTPDKLKDKFKWIETDNVALGCHGLANEGWFDPWCLLSAFRRKATSLGTEQAEGEIVNFKLREMYDSAPFLDKAVIKLKNGEEKEIKFAICVVACGAHSGALSRLMPTSCPPLPVEPRKRFVYNVHCPDGPGLGSPLVIDPSGTYFRREGLAGNYLCGRSPLDSEEPSTEDLEVDFGFFETHVWPVIAARCPAFNNAKLKSAWAGYYDFNAFDENAFIGPHPGFGNVFLATGFSGHGIQQSPAVGRAIAELILDGGYQTINLERMHYTRYIDNDPLWESNIV